METLLYTKYVLWKNIHMTKNKNTSQKKKSLPKATWGTKQQQQTIMAEHTKNKTELRATDPSIAIDRPIESKSEPDGILSAFL